MGITKLFQIRRYRKTFAFKTAAFLHRKGSSRESHKRERGRFQQIITENRNNLANICMHRRNREQCRTERLFLLNILLFRFKLKMRSSELLLGKYAVVYFIKCLLAIRMLTRKEPKKYVEFLKSKLVIFTVSLDQDLISVFHYSNISNNIVHLVTIIYYLKSIT